MPCARWKTPTAGRRGSASASCLWTAPSHRTRALDPAAAPFDLGANTCLHCAGAISCELGLPEDEALADFIVNNVAGRQDGDANAANTRRLAEEETALVADRAITEDCLPQLLGAALCGLSIAVSVTKDCYSAAVAGSVVPRDILERAVYSQMDM